MTVTIHPSRLRGVVNVPLSKSLLHREIICAALAGCSVASVPPVSEDISATKRCAAALLRGGGVLDCGESGTTLRLLLPVAAALGVQCIFTGRGRLPMRPMREYDAALAGSGCRLAFPDSGESLPLSVSGRMRPGVYTLPGNVSSQYVSGMLLALPLLDGDSRLLLSSPLESVSYINMTLSVMRRFGVELSGDASSGWSVCGRCTYRGKLSGECEPDCSQAAFWILASVLGNDVTVGNFHGSQLQGDAAFGHLANEILSHQGGGVLCMDVSQTPDIVPPLAAAAAFSGSVVEFIKAGRLRLKESDRIATTCSVLRALGVRCDESADGFRVYGRGVDAVLNGGEVDGAGDHRIVMTASVLATRAEAPVVISGAEAVAKSYPVFFDDYKSLGGIVS